MNYQSLIYFKTVAEFQHYTKAANALYITQPALSKAIHNLETELGVSLFQKDGRNVSLTACGRLFYDYVNRSVAEIDRGVEAVHQQADRERNVITISGLYTMYVSLLPQTILSFRKSHPDCRFMVEYKYTTSILRDVVDCKTEFGICSDFDNAEGEYAVLDRYLLRKERLILIVSKEHPLAKRKRVSAKELRDENFIVYLRSTLGSNRMLNEFCRKAGYEPNIVAEGYNDYGVFGMVSSGEGISVVSEITTMKTDQVAVLELEGDPVPYRSIYLIWRKDANLTPMAKNFREAILHTARTEAQADKKETAG